jgi:predicted RNA binding protein YcfA (HicA-like mRNA interferase family)
MSVKRNQFIKHLEKHNCQLHRHGSKHDVYQNTITKKKTTVPRHPQIDKLLSEAICKQLEIPKF